jgi:NADH-quinone oxidoreductase subunit C
MMGPKEEAANAAAEARAAELLAKANVAAAEAEVAVLVARSTDEKVMAKEEALKAARLKSSEAGVAAENANALASAPALASGDEEVAKNAARAVADAAAQAVAAATASAQTDWKEDLRRAF